MSESESESASEEAQPVGGVPGNHALFLHPSRLHNPSESKSASEVSEVSESADSHLGRPVRREMVESGSDSATVVAAESEAQLIHQDLMVFQPFQTPLPLLAHNQPDNPVPGQREPH